MIRRRLFWRFYLMLLISLAAMAIVGGLIWRSVMEAPFPPGYEIDVKLVTALLAPTGKGSELQADATRLAETLGARISIFDQDGTKLAEAVDREVHEGGFDGPPDFILPRGRSFRNLRIDLPDGRIVVARDMRKLPGSPPPGFLYMLIAAAGVGIAAYPLVGRITRRLEVLRHAVEDWGAGHLDRRVPEKGRDEIAALGRSFNAAATRIEALVAAHRQLLAHASHELRSPLARLRMAVEMFEATPTDALKGAITQDISELDDLVGEILLASRLDHAEIGYASERIDIVALAAEEAARVGAILVEGPSGSTLDVWGSQRLLRRMIRNLLENAFRHGRPPVEVAVSLMPPDGNEADSRLGIAISDAGPGIPESEKLRIFEPFYRPTGHAESEGSWGLGLALVKRIVTSHNGTVICVDRDGGGTIFRVHLPLASNRPPD